MGSFYTLCSVTNRTIVDGQRMVVQLMLPANRYGQDVSIGQTFVNSFLNAAKAKGVDHAIEAWEEATSTWKSDRELGEKGMRVSNDGAYAEWVPFGPAIHGTYDDCGQIAPDANDENSKRMKILEDLLGGIPFDSIMNACTDTRWYTLGIVKYKDDDNSYWKVKGLDNDTPEWLLVLLKKMSVTYFHESVYNELKDMNFSGEQGVLTDSYDKGWRKENVSHVKKLKKLSQNFLKSTAEKDPMKKLEYRTAEMEVMSRIGTFSKISDELRWVYVACIARTKCELYWFEESMKFMNSLSSMNMRLLPSLYGSQSPNWKGWKRLNASLDIAVDKTIKEYFDQDEEDEAE